MDVPLNLTDSLRTALVCIQLSDELDFSLSLQKFCWLTAGLSCLHSIYIRTVSSSLLFSTMLNWFLDRLGRATCTVRSISFQTSQEGIECTQTKEQLRSYCPDIYVYTVAAYVLVDVCFCDIIVLRLIDFPTPQSEKMPKHS